MGIFLDKTIKHFHYEQKELALIFKEKNINNYPFYNLNWPYPEAIRYYGKTKMQNLDIFVDGGNTIKGPAFFLVNVFNLKYFLGKDSSGIPEYGDIIVFYKVKYLFLFYSDKDLVLPIVPRN